MKFHKYHKKKANPLSEYISLKQKQFIEILPFKELLKDEYKI